MIEVENIKKGYVHQFEDADENPVFPVTVTDAVVDPKTGKTIEVTLDEEIEKVEQEFQNNEGAPSDLPDPEGSRWARFNEYERLRGDGLKYKEDLFIDSNNEVKLADRDNTNGMGYVILRKNKSFAEQVTQENTIYEIRYEFDLNGEEIIIPENCVLDFQGGSLNNGKILFNNTYISNNAKIDCVVKGLIKNTNIYLSWFNNKIYNITSSDINKEDNLDISNKILYFDSTDIKFYTLSIINTNNLIVDGLNNEIEIGDGNFIVYKGVCKNIEVRNFNVKGTTNSVFFYGFPRSTDTESSLNFYIHHNIINTCRSGISLNADGGRPTLMYATVKYNRIIMNNPSSDVGTYGIHIANADHCLIDNNYITGANRHAIYNAYGKYNVYSNNILEKNKEFSNADNSVLHILRKSQHIKVINNTFIGNGGACICVNKYKFDSPVDYDGILCDILIEGNKFYSNNKDYATYFILVGTYDFITGDYRDTKDIVIKNNIFNHNNTKNPKGIVIHEVENLIIESNSFNWIYSEEIAPESSSFFYFAVSNEDTIKNTIITNNTIYANKKINKYVYMFKSMSIPSTLVIQNNKYINQRGTDSVNYNHINRDTISASNIESFNIVTYKYSDNKELVTNTGHYNVNGDIIYTHSLYPNSSDKKPNLGYQCLESGNPGVWMPFGGLANIPEFGGSGIPKGFLGRYHMHDYTPIFCNVEGKWVRPDGYPKDYVRVGDITNIPNIDNFRSEVPFMFLDTTNNRPLWFCRNNTWVDGVGDNKDFKKYGVFEKKPLLPRIGFAYFCTDKATTDGNSNGIMIYHKGNNVWVDALGRVVS